MQEMRLTVLNRRGKRQNCEGYKFRLASSKYCIIILGNERSERTEVIIPRS